MKISYNDWMLRINLQLAHHGQTSQVVEFGKQYLKFNNGTEISGSDFSKFKRRIFNKKTDLWVSNIDNILGGNVTESEIKSLLASIGGVNCQIKHSNNIKKNLNTGVPWNKGKKGIPGHPHTIETCQRISQKNLGKNNGMYGVIMSEEQKKIRSDLMKHKILSGEFTPNSNNRNTHWDATLDGRRYRSSWEALYHYINPGAEYETLRIEYNLDTKKKIYIVDFVDYKNKMVVEVKPRELCEGKKFQAKMAALAQWAISNGHSVTLVDKDWLIKQNLTIDYTRFDNSTAEKIKALYEINKKK